MVEPHKSFAEGGVEWVGHVSLLWWLLFDVVGGLSTMASWMYAHQFVAGSVTTLTILSIFLTCLAKAQHDGEAPIFRIEDFQPDAVRPPPTKSAAAPDISQLPHDNVEIGLFNCHVRDEDTGNPIQGASIRIQNETTGRNYKGTTNRRGSADLTVPNGSYSVTITAATYLDRVCAAKVTDPYGNHMRVALQMTKDERARYMTAQLNQIIHQLMVFTRAGTSLMNKTMREENALEDEVSGWEKSVADYLQSRLNKVHVDIFLSDKDMVEYPSFQGTAFHANLTRLNARTGKLIELTFNLEEQVKHQAF